jgi:hypothetical protein
MAHMRRLQLMLVLALVGSGLAVVAAPYVPLVGELAVYKKGSFDITEAEQVAGSKGERAGAGRESSILGGDAWYPRPSAAQQDSGSGVNERGERWAVS